MLIDKVKHDLRSYVDERIYPGEMLVRLLANDVLPALDLVDDELHVTFFEILEMIRDLPSHCRGSYLTVNSWLGGRSPYPTPVDSLAPERFSRSEF